MPHSGGDRYYLYSPPSPLRSQIPDRRSQSARSHARSVVGRVVCDLRSAICARAVRRVCTTLAMYYCIYDEIYLYACMRYRPFLGHSAYIETTYPYIGGNPGSRSRSTSTLSIGSRAFSRVFSLFRSLFFSLFLFARVTTRVPCAPCVVIPPRATRRDDATRSDRIPFFVLCLTRSRATGDRGRDDDVT